MTDKEKVYWTPDRLDEEQGLCTLNSTDKQYRAYCKWDETIHLWFYDNRHGDYGFDCDTGELGVEAKKTGHHDFYWYIGGVEELDDMIARLQAIKQSAADWYAKRGRRWPPDWEAYTRGEKTLEQAQSLVKALGE